MLNDNYTALCVNRDLLQCWRGRQIPSSLYQGIAQITKSLTQINLNEHDRCTQALRPRKDEGGF